MRQYEVFLCISKLFRTEKTSIMKKIVGYRVDHRSTDP